MVKILFLGDVSAGQTSGMRLRAFKRLGHTVRGVNTIDPWRNAKWLSRQMQRRFERGPIVNAINRLVLDAAKEFQPDIVWAEKQEFLRFETIEALRDGGAKLVHFTPDPYFSLSWKRTRLMDQAILAFDVLVYCKSYERADYENLRKPLVFMTLGYCDEVHRPLTSDNGYWNCDIGFLGGWEPRRERLLSAVATAGLDLNIRGVHWDFLKDGRWTLRRQIILKQFAIGEQFKFHRDELLARALKGGEVYGDDYARSLTGSKIGLGLLRKVCPDQHTTRTFEIPACGSMLLADRTDEHQELFEEGKEAEFFNSPEELLDKIQFYLTNEPARIAIARNGHQRCADSRYAYVHRLELVLRTLTKMGLPG